MFLNLEDLKCIDLEKWDDVIKTGDEKWVCAHEVETAQKCYDWRNKQTHVKHRLRQCKQT